MWAESCCCGPISVGERGSDFYEQVKAHDLGGIVAKRAAAPYAHGVKWHKIKHPNY